AINTAEIAAVGDRYAQIGDGASERVDHDADYIGPHRAAVAPDLIMAIPLRAAPRPAPAGTSRQGPALRCRSPPGFAPAWPHRPRRIFRGRKWLFAIPAEAPEETPSPPRI